MLVALCDNKYQGIVPVPARIGNGQDPGNNLYWGAAFGVRTYFKRSSEWIMVKKMVIDSVRLERLIFKNKNSGYYMVADAYDGKYIKDCTVDYLRSCAGQIKDVVEINDKKIGIYGNAKLLAFIGHDGLMDFTLGENFNNTDGKTRDAIILACYSKSYFQPHLKQTGARPLVWTSGLMAPEAYTLHDALRIYMKNGSAEMIRTSAAIAYSKYQKCSVKAARNLLITGW